MAASFAKSDQPILENENNASLSAKQEAIMQKLPKESSVDKEELPLSNTCLENDLKPLNYQTNKEPTETVDPSNGGQDLDANSQQNPKKNDPSEKNTASESKGVGISEDDNANNTSDGKVLAEINVCSENQTFEQPKSVKEVCSAANELNDTSDTKGKNITPVTSETGVTSESPCSESNDSQTCEKKTSNVDKNESSEKIQDKVVSLRDDAAKNETEVTTMEDVSVVKSASESDEAGSKQMSPPAKPQMSLSSLTEESEGTTVSIEDDSGDEVFKSGSLSKTSSEEAPDIKGMDENRNTASKCDSLSEAAKKDEAASKGPRPPETIERRSAAKSFSDEEVFKKLVTKSLSLDSQREPPNLDDPSGEPMDFHSLIRRNLTKRSVSLSEAKPSGDKPVLETLTFGPSKEEVAKKLQALHDPLDLPCPMCAYMTDNKEDILAHLVLTHKFVIADVNFIANLSNYLKYWKKRLQEKPVGEFCSKIVTNTGTPKEEFFLLCDALPEDKAIRESLQKKKLEMVLAQQQRERDETKFCRQCLFCKQTFCGNRAVLFDHLLRDHTFHMGQPDNLVFTDELFDLIQFKLDSQLCLFCEKSFKDKASLREHMRKKQHRKINAKNKEYDRFYIINYMEMGKNWETLQAEDNRLVRTNEKPSDEEEEWSGWTEETEPQVVCLFCEFSCPTQRYLQQHMAESHDFDLQEVNQKLQLNFYQKVKLINYIRRQVYHKTCYGCMESFEESEELQKHFGEFTEHIKQLPETSIWDQPQYFFPTYEDDSLLCHLDDDDEGAAGDAQGVTVYSEDVLSVQDTILKDTRLRRDLQKV